MGLSAATFRLWSIWTGRLLELKICLNAFIWFFETSIGVFITNFEQLKNATGIDIAGILKTKEKGSDFHFENQYNKQ